jgi:hypothetical protein
MMYFTLFFHTLDMVCFTLAAFLNLEQQHFKCSLTPVGWWLPQQTSVDYLVELAAATYAHRCRPGLQ